MRCEDLTREIASPTGHLSSADVAGHLAACPACAERSRLARRFDRIWDATRPGEPSMDAMDALWVRASAELDTRNVPAVLKFERPARRRWAMAAFVAAQAAAILVAALVLLRLGRDNPVEVADARPAAIAKPGLLHLEVEHGEQAVVRLDKVNHSRVEKNQAQYNASSSLPADTWHDEIDQVESADSSFGTVAIK